MAPLKGGSDYIEKSTELPYGKEKKTNWILTSDIKKERKKRERRKADDDKCWGMKGNDKLEAADWFPSDNFRFMDFQNNSFFFHSALFLFHRVHL